MQVRSPRSAGFSLKTERLGPLPLVNHFIDRMGLAALLDKYVPTTDPRCRVSNAKALGVLLRSIVVEREPIYRAQETVHGFATGLFGVAGGNPDLKTLSDDRLGRALDQLFEADRAAFLTEVVLAVVKRFTVQLEQLHNDSTSIAFCGQYRHQYPSGRSGKQAPAITYGYSKDHRPDLKQLLFILTTDADGGVPVQFRTADGNTNDSITHIETWTSLKAVAGRADFLYVADSKLCSHDNLSFIDRAGGRFVTVLPRSRREDKLFRKWLQTDTPSWELIWDRPSVRRPEGARDIWSVYRDPLGSAEGFTIVWVGARCSPCASRPVVTAISPPRSRRSRRCAGHLRSTISGARWAAHRSGSRDHPREAPCAPLPQGQAHPPTRAHLQADSPRSSGTRHRVPQSHSTPL
jgi:hypothetical protein